MTPILHPELPIKVWMDPRLARMPGVVPLDRGEWLRPDAAYGPQMAERARLIGTREAEVHALLPQAFEAGRELHAMVAGMLPAYGFTLAGGVWTCPDGRRVRDDAAAALLTLGRLVQDDLCLMQEGPEGSHLLTGAILCFPAAWTLAQKIGRDLLRIHVPVPIYDETMARRVQRLFDAIRPENPLMRGNALDYADPALFQPRLENDPRPRTPDEKRDERRYIRAEKQGLVRLPQSRAVVFSIRTHVVDRATLTPEEDRAFIAWRAAHSPGVVPVSGDEA